MNWWLGSAADSSKQASERNNRAARGTIATLPTVASDSDEDLDFADCNSSGLLGLDGADDRDLDAPPGGENEGEMSAQAELARQRALPVEDADFENDEDAWKKELKIKFEPHDVEYWFNTTEASMVTNGINRQWDPDPQPWERN